MNVKYAVVSQDDRVMLVRVGDPEEQIHEGTKLPQEFQTQLYGPNNWVVERVLSPETTTFLEGLLMLVGLEATTRLTQEIFNAMSDVRHSVGKSATNRRRK